MTYSQDKSDIHGSLQLTLSSEFLFDVGQSQS
jgi:hypothetical protein